jgi:hypothetical protein
MVGFLTLGLATLCFGISLFVLRIPIRTIGIFFALGIPLIVLWLYIGDKSKQQEKITNNSSSNNHLSQHNSHVYVLAVIMNKQEYVSIKNVRAVL